MHLGEIPSPLPNSLKSLEVLQVSIYLVKITDRVGNNISKPATPHQKLILSVLRAIAKQQEHIFLLQQHHYFIYLFPSPDSQDGVKHQGKGNSEVSYTLQ